MQEDKMAAAVDALVGARRSFTRIASLPDGSHPLSVGEALAIQDAVITKLGERVAGWKVATTKDGEIMRGAIVGSRLLQSPASLPAAEVPLLGMEGEIAFMFDRALPPRGADYTAGEIRDAATAVVGIEIVASRFLDYAGAPPLDRTADCMSNGAFVLGTFRPDWRRFDLSKLEAILRVNAEVVVRKTGGHVTGDPILPAIALVNALRKTSGVDAGQIITTGTYTGLNFVKPGDRVAIEFAGFGTAEVSLTP